MRPARKERGPSMKRTIEIEVFVDPEGKPICSLEPGKDCQFLRFTHYGTRPVCGFGEQQELYRGMNGIGYIQPSRNCPVSKESAL